MLMMSYEFWSVEWNGLENWAKAEDGCQMGGIYRAMWGSESEY